MRKDDSKLYHKGYGLTNYIEKAVQRIEAHLLFHCRQTGIMADFA
jgi:hypothetical protein